MLIRILTATLMAIFLFTPAANSQDTAMTLTDSKMKIEGTSNIRDWDADAKVINANFVLTNCDKFSITNLTPENFSHLQIQVPVRNIESSTRGLTGNIQKYLKIDRHPQITFQLTSIAAIETVNRDDADIKLTALGTINAAGRPHAVTMEVFGKQNSNNTITFFGTQNIRMTDFNINPPTAMLGTVRAEDEFSVTFSVTFQN